MLSCMNTHKGAHKPFRGHRPFCKLTLLFDNTAHNYDICSDCPSLRINEEQRTELYRDKLMAQHISSATIHYPQLMRMIYE